MATEAEAFAIHLSLLLVVIGVGRRADGARAPVVLVLDQRQRIEASWDGEWVRVAGEARAWARGVRVQILDDVVAEEGAVDESARQGRFVQRVEAQLDLT